MASFAQRRASGMSVRTLQGGAASSQHSRRSSQNSIGVSPVASHLDTGLSELGAGGLGLGASLADELAEDWDEEGGEEEEEEEAEEGDGAEEGGAGAEDGHAREERVGARQSLLMPGSPTKSRLQSNGHQRTDSAYDGSDYGDDSDLVPVQGFTPFLEKGMADVEALARMHVDTQDGIWERAIAQLRDLPPQLALENASARLATASAAATAHLESSSRAWPQLTHAIMTPWAATASGAPLAPADVEAVEALVAELVGLLPRPPHATLESMHALNGQTSDVLASLGNIIDQLHMQKQASTKAAQRLKAVRDVVVALRRDMDLGQEGIAWLESENWNERIKSREAATICRDVVAGFEAHCDSWRNRLIEQAGGSAAAAAAAAGAAAAGDPTTVA